jgi:hypothetical protein
MGLKSLLDFILCQGRKKQICDIDDHDTKYVFEFKGTQVVYLNPNLNHI